MKPSLILINPWIYDFAAYDLWSKPLGLLSIAGYLRRKGFRIHFIDCLDIHRHSIGSDDEIRPRRRDYGTGKFRRTKMAPPHPFSGISRTYSRYGASIEAYREALRRVSNPAAILVTSLMTYWYPGVRDAVTIAKEVHPGTPVILGGIYARLCHEHAVRTAGADHVSSAKEPEEVLAELSALGLSYAKDDGAAHSPYPAFDLLSRMDYACLSASYGCPYRCRYCASRFLQPQFTSRDPQEVRAEVLYWHQRFKVCDFAFYDDALLSSQAKASALLEGLVRIQKPLRFHTPNALHAREVTPETARLMFRAGFRTIRLGLETSDFSFRRRLDSKISEGEFERAAQNLHGAGFTQKELGAYIMVGLPGQSAESVEETIRLAAKAGVTPYLAEYSPIPHTDLWEEAVAASEYPIGEEPLFQNNTLLACWNEREREALPRLKRLVGDIRKRGVFTAC